jgi:hypothetical protein
MFLAEGGSWYSPEDDCLGVLCGIQHPDGAHTHHTIRITLHCIHHCIIADTHNYTPTPRSLYTHHFHLHASLPRCVPPFRGGRQVLRGDTVHVHLRGMLVRHGDHHHRRLR